jgi:uncharacterized protein (DUF488 family)
MRRYAAVRIYTIGFTQRTAESFFEALRDNGIERLVDVRLNNTSQLAGFAKGRDLPYFLKAICGSDYVHEPLLAPTQDLLDDYKKQRGSWARYESAFMQLMQQRRIEQRLDRRSFDRPSVLLCSERTAERCHRRLVIE